MEWISKADILIVGLGLMGGSYAKALSRLGYHVSAIDTDAESIAYALENKIISEGQTEVTEDFVSQCDAVIFALYPRRFKEWIEQYQQYLRPGTMITDVTGVKSSVVYEIQAVLRDDLEYIPAHPMAGRERCGVRNSDDSVFHGANYIVTPTEKNSPEAVEWCQDLGRILGFARISVLTPEEHDRMIAFVSQLTHCIAVSLMNCSDDHHLADYTGDSFRDLTRIARINDEMWSELFLMNRGPLLEQMDVFLREFTELRDLLADGEREKMREKMRISTERRAWFDK